jgi:hypothetical protein
MSCCLISGSLSLLWLRLRSLRNLHPHHPQTEPDTLLTRTSIWVQQPFTIQRPVVILSSPNTRLHSEKFRFIVITTLVHSYSK